MMRNRFSTCAVALLFSLTAVTASGQKANPAQPTKSAGGGGLSISPSRLELKMLPGSSKTFVVRVLHGEKGAKGDPARLLARLNDWKMDRHGRVTYYKPNTVQGSAAAWITYSPSEISVPAGEAHSVRVTVTVPKDATPGDHATALVIQPRPGNLKQLTNQKRMVFRFRLASTLYIQVPTLRPKPALIGLTASASEKQVVVKPTLRNTGNSLVRPRHSAKVLDTSGKVVAQHDGADVMPLLAGATLEPVLIIDTKGLPAGQYAVRYRVDFRNRDAVVEGRTKLEIR